LNEIVAIFQTIATVAAAGAIFIHLGHRDEQLNSLARSVDQLRKVVDDLVKTTVAVTTTIQYSQRMHEDTARRIDRLEQNHRFQSTGCSAPSGSGGGLEL